MFDEIEPYFLCKFFKTPKEQFIIKHRPGREQPSQNELLANLKCNRPFRFYSKNNINSFQLNTSLFHFMTFFIDALHTELQRVH